MKDSHRRGPAWSITLKLMVTAEMPCQKGGKIVLGPRISEYQY